jgi:hypothetical protein
VFITRRRTSAAAAGALVALTSSFAVASAHDVFTAGPYRLAIGWQFEPASGSDTYVDAPNAIQVFIDIASLDNPHGTPVSTLNGDCAHPDFQVTVTAGGTTSSPFCPSPVHDPDTGNGRLDEYDYPLIPTLVGTYTFHVFGTINGTRLDQKIISGPATFDSIADSSSAEFPVAVPAVSALSTKVDAVNQRASSARARALSAATTAAAAKTDAAGASTLAIIAIVVAVLLSALNLAIAARRRSTKV